MNHLKYNKVLAAAVPTVLAAFALAGCNSEDTVLASSSDNRPSSEVSIEPPVTDSTITTADGRSYTFNQECVQAVYGQNLNPPANGKLLRTPEAVIIDGLLSSQNEIGSIAANQPATYYGWTENESGTRYENNSPGTSAENVFVVSVETDTTSKIGYTTNAAVLLDTTEQLTDTDRATLTMERYNEIMSLYIGQPEECRLKPAD